MQDIKKQILTAQKKGPFQSKILENVQISPDIYKLRLENQLIAENSLPGQFVSVKCKNLILRRPFSVAKVYDDNSFDMIYKVIGEGTDYLSGLKKDDIVDYFGPMGNSFKIEDKNSLLIGCGVGIAPIIFLEDCLKKRKIEHTMVIGSKTAINMAFLKNTYLISEDGTTSLKGRLDHHLEEIIAETKPEKIFICGPNPAMKYTTELAKKYGLEIEVALERVFACGTGACMGCVIQTMENGEQIQKRVCKDGPVFNGETILWE